MRVRSWLTYANVMATIAVFIALGGGAMALSKGEIKRKHIAKKAVGTQQLAPNAVKRPKIAPGAIDGSRIAASAIGRTHLDDASVTSGAIAGGSVHAAHLADGSVTGDAIAPAAVGADALAPAAVGAPALDAGSVGSEALAADAVTSAKLASGAVTSSRLAPALGLRCQFLGQILVHAACIETSTRTAATAASARATCESAGGRLPSIGEVQSFRQITGQSLGAGSWTNIVYLDITGSGPSDFLLTPVYVTNNGTLGYGTSSTPLAYRCVRMPAG